MKKVFFMIVLLFHAHAWAVNCPEGNIIKGKNNVEYCISRITMNWFTAFAWCDSFGLKLQTLFQVCDNGETKWDGNTGIGKCINFVDSGLSGNVWTATSYTNNNAFYVYFPEASVLTIQRDRKDMRYAICR